MLTREKIEQIKALRYNGCTIERIAKDLKFSTRTVLKYLKHTANEPKPVTLLDEINSLKAITKDHEKEIQHLKEMIQELKSIKLDPEILHKDKNTISTINVPCTIDVKKIDPDSEKYYSTPQVAKELGIPSKTIRDMCKKWNWRKDERDHYKVLKSEFVKFKENWKPRNRPDKMKNHPLKPTESS